MIFTWNSYIFKNSILNREVDYEGPIIAICLKILWKRTKFDRPFADLDQTRNSRRLIRNIIVRALFPTQIRDR